MELTYVALIPKKDFLLYLLIQKSGAIVIAFARNDSDNSSFKSIRYLVAKSSIVRETICRLGKNSLMST